VELLGDALARVLAGVRAKMDEEKTGEVVSLPGKVAPGGGGAGVKGRGHIKRPLASERVSERAANSGHLTPDRRTILR
jgi:hypothetical protein